MMSGFVADDSGQDVVEYALLAALIGISSIVAWKVLAVVARDVYLATNTDVQVLAPPPNPK